MVFSRVLVFLHADDDDADDDDEDDVVAFRSLYPFEHKYNDATMMVTLKWVVGGWL